MRTPPSPESVRRGRLIVAGILFSVLTVYVFEHLGPRTAFHSFNFGSAGGDENIGVEILDYRYGDSKVTGTYADRRYTDKDGRISQGNNVGGSIPVGEYLYVQWRVLATGKVYEDKVDLRSRLPWNMEGKHIHFLIKGSQLVVYVAEGNDKEALHAKGAPDCPAAAYEDVKCTRIYPDYWKNF